MMPLAPEQAEHSSPAVPGLIDDLLEQVGLLPSDDVIIQSAVALAELNALLPHLAEVEADTVPRLACDDAAILTLAPATFDVLDAAIWPDEEAA